MLNELTPSQIFNYIVTALAIAVFINHIKPAPYLLVGLTVAIVVIYLLHTDRLEHGQNFIADMKLRLSHPLFKNTRYMYTDSEIATFLYNARQYHFANPAVFYQLTQLIDNFLHVINDMKKGVVRMGENYEIATDYKFKVLNCFQSLIHSLPITQVTMDNYHHSMSKLEELLNYQLDQVYRLVRISYGKEPININTKFIYRNMPTGADPEFNQNYNFF